MTDVAMYLAPNIPFKPRAYALVGSRVIKGVEDPKDYDYIVLCRRRRSKIKKLEKAGFHVEAGRASCYGAEFLKSFVSLRRGVIDIILTQDRSFYRNFIRASDVCVALDLISREDRIRVHKTLMYGLDRGVE